MGKIRNKWGFVPVFEALEPRLLLSGDLYDTTGIIESDPALAEMLEVQAERFAPGELLIKLKDPSGSFGLVQTSVVAADGAAAPDPPTSPLEIGRASCRERG